MTSMWRAVIAWGGAIPAALGATAAALPAAQARRSPPRRPGRLWRALPCGSYEVKYHHADGQLGFRYFTVSGGGTCP